MPNPKTGTVTLDVAKAVSEIKGGKINFRIDEQANLHFVIGKASFDEILSAKPASSKGRYLNKIVVSTTTGPGIQVDPSVMRVSQRRNNFRKRAPRLPGAGEFCASGSAP